MPTKYVVVWTIDLEAETSRQAAAKALAIHRNPDSIATVFDVYDQDRGGKVMIDLTPEEPTP